MEKKRINKDYLGQLKELSELFSEAFGKLAEHLSKISAAIKEAIAMLDKIDTNLKSKLVDGEKPEGEGKGQNQAQSLSSDDKGGSLSFSGPKSLGFDGPKSLGVDGAGAVGGVGAGMGNPFAGAAAQMGAMGAVGPMGQMGMTGQPGPAGMMGPMDDGTFGVPLFI